MESEGLVLGWEVRRSTPHFVLLAAASRLGLRAEVLLKRRSNGLLFATFVQQENAVARAVWARVAPGHRRFVKRLLEQTIGRPSRSRASA
jgi:hypothetical protein